MQESANSSWDRSKVLLRVRAFLMVKVSAARLGNAPKPSSCPMSMISPDISLVPPLPTARSLSPSSVTTKSSQSLISIAPTLTPSTRQTNSIWNKSQRCYSYSINPNFFSCALIAPCVRYANFSAKNYFSKNRSIVSLLRLSNSKCSKSRCFIFMSVLATISRSAASSCSLFAMPFCCCKNA